jgi:hypothetical protein
MLGVAAVSFGMALALVVGAAVLLGASLSLPMVWAAVAAVVGFKLLSEAGERPTPPPTPPTHPEPEVPLADLDALYRMWQRGDISEAAYRRAVAQATRRYSPPPPPAPPRRHRRWW